MRTASLVALLLALVGCAVDSGSPGDGIDELGVEGGKADGRAFTTCELDAVVAHLNAGVSADDLFAGGVHRQAADNLAWHRDGVDATFGTEDDDPFDGIDEVDGVPHVGPEGMRQLVEIVASRCPAEPTDPADPTAPTDPTTPTDPTPPTDPTEPTEPTPIDYYAGARDVTLPVVELAADAPIPTSYDYPSGGSFSLGGTEFWQKWSGGHNPTYSFAEGTDFGRRCMQASAIRFEAIMASPPAELVRLNEQTNWSGSFFNWNDDYSQSTWGDASGARLWAWRTGLIKWISQTARDGSCRLPTLDMVRRVAEACLQTAERNGNGEIQGCSAS
ncbi:MAG: hypothetical protein IT379_00540 [Deltaproteobacteria bacterium]|nr:hypothetical protein [Deltaproteobacteria bacterium]